MSLIQRAVVCLTALSILSACLSTQAADDERPARREAAVIGRWDLTAQSKQGDFPSWLEVRRSGHNTLVGSFVGRFGSARPVGHVRVVNGKYRFTIPPQWEQQIGRAHV